METRISPAAVAAMLLSAPVWAKLGLAVKDQRMQERAADAIAARIVAELDAPPAYDDRQIALPL